MLQSGSLTDEDQVLLVDDWIQTGSQALAARALIEGTGARFAGLAVIVRDRLSDAVQEGLRPLHFLIDAGALGPADALPSEP